MKLSSEYTTITNFHVVVPNETWVFPIIAPKLCTHKLFAPFAVFFALSFTKLVTGYIDFVTKHA